MCEAILLIKVLCEISFHVNTDVAVLVRFKINSTTTKKSYLKSPLKRIVYDANTLKQKSIFLSIILI